MRSSKIIFISILVFLSKGLYAHGAFCCTESRELITEPFVKNHCQILHENLAIDLRPVQWDSYVLVKATYDIFLDRTADSLLFVFAAASKIPDLAVVELNGLPVTITKVDSNQNLPDIKIPVATPWSESDRGSDRSDKPDNFKEDYVFYKLKIPGGKHRLVMRYKSRAIKSHLYYSQANTRLHTLSYALYPAKNWKSFGGLDLEVKYPPGWEIKSSLELSNEDNILKGNFKYIPDDFIYLHVRYPDARAGFYKIAYEVIVIAMIVLVSYLLLRKMRRFKLWFIRVASFVALAIMMTICYLLAYLNKDIFFEYFITNEVNFSDDRAFMILGTPVLLVLALILLLILNWISIVFPKIRKNFS